MVSLDRFDTFKAVVEAGSLTAAADLLGQTRAVVSFNLKRLEEELGVTLLTRNTRQLALTDAGEQPLAGPHVSRGVVLLYGRLLGGHAIRNLREPLVGFHVARALRILACLPDLLEGVHVTGPG